MDLLTSIGAALVFLAGTTYALKATGKAQTFYLFSLIRTKRFLPLLDRFKKYKRLMHAIADAGLVLGFGAIAVDYLWGRKKDKPTRVALFAVSSLALYLLLELLSGVFFVFQTLISNPLTESSNFIVKIAFATTGFAGAMLVVLAAYSWFIIESVLAGKKACPGIAPIIPGVQIPKVPIVVPLHGWISFLIILLLHEGMHGILAREAKVRIKNAGLLLAGLLPIGAFVEPDEKELRKAQPLAQVRTYSAGPSINIFASMALPVLVTIFLLVVYLPFFSGPMKEERLGSVAGVFVTSVDQNIDLCGQAYENPAYGKLLPGMRLLKINDRNIVTEDDAALALYLNKKPFTVQLMDANGAIVAHTIVPNELGLATFGIEEAKKPGYVPSAEFDFVSTVGSVLTDFIFWLMLLNFLIAVVNFLPTEPFDGGKIAKIILLPYFGWLKMNKKETETFIGRLFTWIIAGLILANALPFFF